MKILITGASSGMGFDAARTLARKGHEVYAGARRVKLMEPLKADGVKPLFLDVTSEASIQACLAEVGTPDVLVNCAGYGSFGAIENVSMEEARKQLDVNLFGLARLCQLVLPGMRENHGRIINVGSVAGKACLYFGGWYNVSKFAVEAFTDALRMEMQPLGVSVVLIEPGATRTGWAGIAADHLEASSAGTPYEVPAANEAALFRKTFGWKLFSEPSVVTKSIVRACTARRPRTRYRPAFGACSMVFWHALLPDRWWDALMRQLGKTRRH